jgi:hypothetical protein
MSQLKRTLVVTSTTINLVGTNESGAVEELIVFRGKDIRGAAIKGDKAELFVNQESGNTWINVSPWKEPLTKWLLDVDGTTYE